MDMMHLHARSEAPPAPLPPAILEGLRRSIRAEIARDSERLAFLTSAGPTTRNTAQLLARIKLNEQTLLEIGETL